MGPRARAGMKVRAPTSSTTLISTPTSLGTLPTHTPLFVSVLVGVVLLVGALTYLPALALGPIAEQLALR